MLIFVFESVTAGFFSGGEQPPASLAAEGRAMLDALTTDFAAIDGVRVKSLWDDRLGDPPQENHTDSPNGGRSFDLVAGFNHVADRFAELAARADATLLIAPELSGELLGCAQAAIESGARLISPDPDFVQIAADKGRMGRVLCEGGVPAPVGRDIDPARRELADVSFPAVLKPALGAGSADIFLLKSSNDWRPADLQRHPAWRLESYVPGCAVSVSLLCAGANVFPLPACRQHLSDDGRFTYQGGSLPLAGELDRRACELAVRAVKCLPPTFGYVGIDLVLGDDPTGGGDCVIEINPRLTTSYVGLRALAKENLAAAMLSVARGQRPQLSWRTVRIEFDPKGAVREGKANRPSA